MTLNARSFSEDLALEKDRLIAKARECRIAAAEGTDGDEARSNQRLACRYDGRAEGLSYVITLLDEMHEAG